MLAFHRAIRIQVNDIEVAFPRPPRPAHDCQFAHTVTVQVSDCCERVTAILDVELLRSLDRAVRVHEEDAASVNQVRHAIAVQISDRYDMIVLETWQSVRITDEFY